MRYEKPTVLGTHKASIHVQQATTDKFSISADNDPEATSPAYEADE
jgi:hypothetical protein